MNVPQRPRLLAILPGFTASTLMDVVKPLLALQAAGKIHFQVALDFLLPAAHLPPADLVVFCRNTEPRFAAALEAVLARGTPYMYDLDDNLFDIHLDDELGRYHSQPERQVQLARYVQGASLVRVYSEPLRRRVLPLNPAVEQVAAPLHWELIEPPAPRPASAPVRIVYVTSRKDDYLYPLFAPALHATLQAHPAEAEAVFWGYLPEEFKGYSNVHFRPFVPNYNRFLRQFSRQGFEIGLAPLLDDDFHRSKTNNKFREYAACGVAGIYSRVDVYTDCVEDGLTGLLVDNTPESWAAALERLVTQPELRARIAQRGRAEVQRLYSAEAFCAAWQRQIAAVLANPQPPARPGPTVPAAKPTPAPGRGKLGRAAERLRRFGPQALARTLALQARDRWMVYQINHWKRL